MYRIEDDKLKEQQLTSEIAFEGRLLQVKVDTVSLPNGATSTREYINHPGAVAILPITNDGKIVFVKQFRYPLGTVILEVPAGKLDPGEEPIVCAHRELSEETGYRAEHMEYLASIATTPGFTDEIIHLYVAKGLEQFIMHPDADEFIETIEYTKEEVLQMIQEQKIFDCKTLVVLSRYFMQTLLL